MSEGTGLNKTFIKRIIPVLAAALIAIFFVMAGDESGLTVFTYGDHMKLKAGDTEGDYAVIRESDGFAGIFLEGPTYLLNSGSYRIGIFYRATDPGSSVAIMDNGRPIAVYDLDPHATNISCPVTLVRGSERISYAVSFSGMGELVLERSGLNTGGRFYNDSYYISAVIVLIAVAACIVIYISPAFDKKGLLAGAVLTAAGFGAFIPYWDKGLPWAIDLCYHLSRIEGIKDGLMAGQFPVILYPEALYGNGYLGAMYPSLFLYPAAFLRLLGVSVADSFKSVVLCFHLLTAFITYYCIRQIRTGILRQHGDYGRAGALMGAVVYTLLPYRITNLYARGAVGEFLAMTFYPLVIAGLYHIIKGKREKWGLLALGMSGLVYSHLLSAAVAGLICGVCALVFIRDLIKDKRFIGLFMAAGLSAILSAAFLLPFMYYYKNGNLWMEVLDAGGDFVNTSLNPSGLFAQPFTGDYHVLSLGIAAGVCLVIAVLSIAEGICDKSSEQPGRDFVIALTVMGTCFGLMATSLFPARQLVAESSLAEAFTSKLQFAWRLLGPAAVLIIFAGAIGLCGSRLLSAHRGALVVLLCVISLFSVLRFRDEDFANRYDRPYSNGHASKLTGIPRGENTIVYPFEWRPEGTTDDSLATNVTVSDETVEVLLHYRSATISSLVYSDIEEGEGGSFVELPVLYYPGYRAFDENNRAVTIAPGTANRIRVYLDPDGYEHNVTVLFFPPLICRIGFFISVLGIALSLMARVIYNSRKDSEGNDG